MRLLGIDYGEKRVGTALTNEDGDMAFPHEVFQNDKELVKKIEELVAEKEVQKIVIGHSLDRKGGENKLHERVTEFIQDLTLNIGIPVELEPEQYTTQEALRDQGRTDMTDASAAAIILNSYITKQKPGAKD